MTAFNHLWGMARESLARLRGTFHRQRDDRELQEELQLHLELAAEEARRRGVPPDIAGRYAMIIAGASPVMDALRDQRGLPWLEDLAQDVRFAIRALRKQPGFTTVAIVTLALGIGANTATFSVVHSVLLQPLPYRDSARLVRVWETVPGPEIGNGKGPAFKYDAMDVADALAVSSRSDTIAQLAGYSLVRPTAIVHGAAIRMEGFSVSGGFFDMLGVQPLLGRTFSARQAGTGYERVLVLGHNAWHRLGGDPQVLGRVLTFSADPLGASGGGAIGRNVAYTVIGVMPRNFQFPRDTAQFWIPRALTALANVRPLRLATLARLAGDATPGAAAAELEAIQRHRRGSSAAAPAQPRFELIPLQEEVTGPVRPALLVLISAVAVVLLIACVNMANLLLARSESRHREMAVRAAIGAGRGRLVRQLFTESLLLSGLGGVAGTGLAYLGVRLFRALGTTLGRADLGSTAVFPRLSEVAIDWTVLGYALVLSIGTGLLFGLVPAFRGPRPEQRNFLRDATTSPQTRVKSTLVVLETALAMVLLVGGGLLIHSFVKLATVDVGFDASHLLTFQVTVPAVERPDQQRTFAETLVERLRSLPGVSGAAYARQLPLVQLRDSITLTTRRNGVEVVLGEAPDIRFVSTDYLTTLGARIVSGRGFRETDHEGQRGAVIINEALAQRDFLGGDPIGQVVYLGTQRQLPFEIVGVVGNIRQQGLDRAPRPQYFIDIRQVPTDGTFRAPPLFPLGAYYCVRTSADMAVLVSQIRTVIREMQAQATLDNVATMEQILSNSITRPWMYAVLLGIFAAVALCLAAIGLYGVMAYTVTQRTREIGIRMALGADRRRVVALVLRHSAALTILGLVIGLAGAIFTTRYLTGLLFGLTPLDPITYVVAASMFALVAMIASYLPARHATNVDPMIALRNE
ncbi:MAG: ABC transporter permease [Acidobacteria bacterium]|nr:ABC transporter permease [Acidobacteriota bacterium]